MNTVGPAATRLLLKSKPLVLGLQLAKYIADLYPAATEFVVMQNVDGVLTIELYELADVTSHFLHITESDDHQLEVTETTSQKSYKSPFDYGLQASAAGIVRELLPQDTTTEG